MLNGRKQDFTCISKRGKSVVDFIITTHENIHMCTDFDVKIMSDITNELELQDMNQIPDHSVLTVSFKRESANQQDKTPQASYSDIQKLPSKPRSRSIPNEFLNDDTVRVKIEQVIQNIENNLTVKQDVDAAYGCFVELISDEVKSKIGEKSEGDNQYRKSKGKSRYKPYWNDNLKLLWDKTCEHKKVWLKWKGCGTKKKRVREQFLTSRNAFDKLLRKEKRSYQMRQQQELLNLSTENNTRDFWKKIGKLGIANDRRSSIPMEVLTSEGNVCKDIKTVYDTWKSKYEHLFNVTDCKYDEDFLCTVQHQLENEIINLSGKESEILNNDISYDDVEKAVYRAKLNKAGGLDQICAEFLQHKQLETVQNKACRYYLGAFKNSSNLAIRGDMGWSTVKTKQNIEVLRLYFKVTNLDGNRLVKQIYESSKSKQRSWHSRVLKFIKKRDLSSLINAQNMTIRQKVNIVKDKLNTMDAENWLRDVHNDINCENGNKLRTFRQYKSYLQPSSYVKSVKFRDYRRT
ncbi:unnamed protein product [Mytilus edulis]|uniref:Uncharacterized protein n=1 Tax=Mytilus edulis TaxID=6550 RepID=A0A8S3RJG0_MYTED|nr:unnamed protein product [Mytilus edulis]